MARRSWKETKEFSIQASPDTIADIREAALLAFFNRFCKKEVDSMKTRKSRRKVTNWLDKNDVRIQDSNESHDFLVMIPTQTTAMYVGVHFDAKAQMYKYRYTLVDKHNLEPLEDS